VQPCRHPLPAQHASPSTRILPETAPAPNLQAQLVASVCVTQDAISNLVNSAPFYTDDAPGAGLDGLLCDKTSQLLTEVLGAQLLSLQVTLLACSVRLLLIILMLCVLSYCVRPLILLGVVHVDKKSWAANV
jgi:hypothetical protein